MYVYTRTHTYTSICIYIHIYIYIYIYIYMYMYMCVYTQTHTYICIFVSIHTQTHIVKTKLTLVLTSRKTAPSSSARIVEARFSIPLHTDNFCRCPVTWLIHILWQWHDPFICVWRKDYSYIHVTWLIRESGRRALTPHSISRDLLSLPCDMTHSFVCDMRMTHIYMWHDSSIRESGRRAFISNSELRTSAVTLWHYSFTYVWHEDNSYIHVTCVL